MLFTFKILPKNVFTTKSVSLRPLYTSISLFKKGKKREQSSSETSDDFSDTDNIPDKNTKIINSKMLNLRLDSILKTGLGMARNKIEVIFYESKIRRNGQKVLKKSDSIQEGDEIDVIKGVSPDNPNFLNVARVEVLRIKPREEHIDVKLRRNKNLLVENYQDAKWKSSSDSS